MSKHQTFYKTPKDDPRFHVVRLGLFNAGFREAALTLKERWFHTHPEKDREWLFNFWTEKLKSLPVAKQR